jgi:hypothetical protein
MGESRFDEAVLKDLKHLRDEARLNAHLFTAEMRTQMEKLEAEWKSLKRNLKQDEPALIKSMESVSHATKPILGDLRAAYSRLIERARASSR